MEDEMYYLEEMCCLCLKHQNSNLGKFNSENLKRTTNINNFGKVSRFLTNISKVIKLDDDNMICKSCLEALETDCGFIDTYIKHITILHSYKSLLKQNKEKKPGIIKIEMNRKQILNMDDTNQVGNVIELLSVSFSDSKFNLSSENYTKIKVENDSDLESSLMDAEEIKMEIEEADMKKECFDDMCEDMLKYNDQYSNTAVSEDYPSNFHFVDIEDFRDQEVEIFSTIAEEKPLGSNEGNIPTSPNFVPVEIQHASDYKCDTYKKTFTTESCLDLHDRVGSKTNENLESDHCLSDQNSSNVGEKLFHEKPYVCEICSKSFTRKDSLDIHTRIHTGEKPYVCEICNQSFTYKTGLNIHTLIHTGKKPYVCEICNKSFKQKGNLDVHTRIHTGGKPYVCEICNQSFTYKTGLNIHTRIHTGEKPYVCEICNKSFPYKTGLNIHIRIHTGEKPYVCEICNKSFKQKGNLDIHSRIHTGEKPFVCEICNKSFKHKGTLDIHSRIHTGEKPYICEICNKSFKQKGTLDVHTRIHTGEKPYVCELCNKSFSYKTCLNIHTRSHTKEKPYKCKICNKSFKQKGTVDVHARIHTGEKPYVCGVCNKSFTYKHNLDSHKNVHIPKIKSANT